MTVRQPMAPTWLHTRAILEDAPIVILDEPTAALDGEIEFAVQQAIDVLVRDKTVVVIAHRLSTVVAANLILVPDGGASPKPRRRPRRHGPARTDAATYPGLAVVIGQRPDAPHSDHHFGPCPLRGHRLMGTC